MVGKLSCGIKTGGGILTFETRWRLRSGSLEQSPGALCPPCEPALVFLGTRGAWVGSPWRTGQAPRPRTLVRSLDPTGIRDGLTALPPGLGGQRPRGPDLRAPGAPAPWPFGGSLRSLDGGARLLFRMGSPVLGNGAPARRSPDGKLRPGDAIRLPGPSALFGGTERTGVIGAPRPLSLGGSDAGQDPLRKDNSVGTRRLNPFFFFLESFYGGWGGVSQSLEKCEYRFQEVGCEPRLLLKIARFPPPPLPPRFSSLENLAAEPCRPCFPYSLQSVVAVEIF